MVAGHRLRRWRAGHYRPQRETALDAAELQKHLDVNYRGALHLLGVVLPPLLAAGTGTFAFIAYESNAEALIAKGAPVRSIPLQNPEFGRRQWVSATAGPHPNAARLLLHPGTPRRRPSLQA